MILFLLVGTFIGEYEASYLKKHNSLFTATEYTWIIALGQVIIALVTYPFLPAYDWSSVDLRAIGATVLLVGCAWYFCTRGFANTLTVDRSMAANFGVISIPIVLLSDVALGYDISRIQIVVIGVMALLFFATQWNARARMRGVGSIVIANATAVASIVIFKYSTSHWVTVQMQIFLTAIGMFIFMLLLHPLSFVGLMHRSHERRVATIIAVFHGISSMLNSFAFAFGLASIVTTIKRVIQLMRGLLFAKIAFHEHHMARKTIVTLLLAICIIILQYPQLLEAIHYFAY